MPYDEEVDLDQELTLLDIWNIFWRGRFLVLFLAIFFGLAGAVYSLFMPTTYRSVCKIITGQSGGVGGLAGSGLAELFGMPARTTNAQMLIAMMKVDSVVDIVIDELNLMEGLSPDKRYALRGKIGGSVNAKTGEGGIIDIECINTDSEDTALIANAFVGAVQKKMQELSIEDAQQKRRFFEEQLLLAQQELSTAEDAMAVYQRSSGLVAFESQTQSLLSSIASLRNQIAAKNVEISSLKSYTRNDNPRLRLAQSQLDAMTKELRRLEEESRTNSRQDGINPYGDLSSGRIPELEIEYQRYARALRFATAKYEAMMRQYESAKLSEVNDISSVSVVEPAVPPRGKYGPKRTRIALAAFGGGFVLGIFIVFLVAHIRTLRKNQEDIEEEEY